jgi:hypothetical protein
MERHVQPTEPTDPDTHADRSGAGGGPGSLREALAALDTLGDRPLEEHINTYEALHERLQAELGSIESS